MRAFALESYYCDSPVQHRTLAARLLVLVHTTGLGSSLTRPLLNTANKNSGFLEHDELRSILESQGVQLSKKELDVVLQVSSQSPVVIGVNA